MISTITILNVSSKLRTKPKVIVLKATGQLGLLYKLRSAADSCIVRPIILGDEIVVNPQVMLLVEVETQALGWHTYGYGYYDRSEFEILGDL